MKELDKPTMAALLRIAIQSLDAGGESARSLRALAIETVWHSIFKFDPEFSEANRKCDEDPWAFLTAARRECIFGDDALALTSRYEQGE